MKPVSSLQKLFFFPMMLFICALIISAQDAPPAQKEMTLQEAIAAGDIQASAISVGKYRGKSVRLEIKNNAESSLKISVPAGTAYYPEDEKEQTLIQLEEDFFVVAPNTSTSHMIAAFCTEATDSSPSKDGEFKISTSPNKKLNEAIAYIANKKIDKKSFQSAVWAITNDRSISNIEADDQQTKDFRTYLAELTGQKDTWYTLPQQHILDEQRRIQTQTTAVRGQIKFPSDGTSIMRQEVVDATGTVRFALPPSKPHKSDDVTMNFSVRVHGWTPGEYTLRILKDDEEIKTYPFVIS